MKHIAKTLFSYGYIDVKKPEIIIFDINSITTGSSLWKNLQGKFFKLSKTYDIYIITNQHQQDKLEQKLKRIENICVEIPQGICEVLISTSMDIWRKPNTTIIEKLIPYEKKITIVGGADDRYFAYNTNVFTTIMSKKSTQYVTIDNFNKWNSGDFLYTPLKLEFPILMPKADQKWKLPIELKKAIAAKINLLIVGPQASCRSTLVKFITKCGYSGNLEPLVIKAGETVFLDAMKSEKKFEIVILQAPPAVMNHIKNVKQKLELFSYGPDEWEKLEKLVADAKCRKILVPFYPIIKTQKHKIYYSQFD
jgi:hypothetical protein